MNILKLEDLEAIRLRYSNHSHAAGIAESARPYPNPDRQALTYRRFIYDGSSKRWKWENGSGGEEDTLMNNIPAQGWNGQALEFWDGLHRGYENLVPDVVWWKVIGGATWPNNDNRADGWHDFCKAAGGSLYGTKWNFGFRHGYGDKDRHLFHAQGARGIRKTWVYNSTTIPPGEYLESAHIFDPYADQQSLQFKRDNATIFRRNGVWWATQNSPADEILEGETNEETFEAAPEYPPETGWGGTMSLQNQAPHYRTELNGENVIFTDLYRQGHWASLTSSLYDPGSSTPHHTTLMTFNWWNHLKYINNSGAPTSQQNEGRWIVGGKRTFNTTPTRMCDWHLLYTPYGPSEPPHTYQQKTAKPGQNNSIDSSTLTQQIQQKLPPNHPYMEWEDEGIIMWENDVTTSGEWGNKGIGRGNHEYQYEKNLFTGGFREEWKTKTIEFQPIWNPHPILGQWLLDDINHCQDSYDNYAPPEDIVW